MSASEQDAVRRLAERLEKVFWPNGSSDWQAAERFYHVLRESHLPELLEAGEKMPHQIKYVKGAGFGGSTAKMCKENCARCTWDAAKAVFEGAT
jgi:5-formaminoimidazole-4-carboxamide-1-beta-D-ribofuranosyl 5'-monophosphate synthetase